MSASGCKSRRRPFRLAIVAQRFWPRVGSLETRVGQLACGLADAGVEVTIVTARWHLHWPAEIYFHEVPVVRLRPPPTGRWTAWRWSRALAHWMRRNIDRFDGVLVWGLMHEARAVVDVVGVRGPVVLTPDRTGLHGDCFRQAQASDEIRRACQRARAVVACTPAARRELEAAGYRRERIFDVPMGVPLSPPRTPQNQTAARDLLADSNPVLQLPGNAPLAVATTRLAADRGWEDLLTAWSIVTRQKSAAQLWLPGEAPAADSVARQVTALGLGKHVSMLGMFDDVQALLAAADVHIAPAVDGSPQALLEAMAAGTPSVAIDVPVNRWFLGDEAAGLLVPAEDSESLAEGILRLLDDPGLAARLGSAGWQRAQADFDLAKMVEGYLDLFENRLTSTRCR